MVAINVLPERYPLPEWKRFWAAVGGGYEVRFAQDIGKRVAAAFQVRELGTTIIIDRQGSVVYRDWGPTSYGTLARVVDKLL